MFKEKYRRDNQLLKAPEKIPEVISQMANNPEKSTDRKSSLLRITAAAAAVCVLLAGIAALPFVLGSSRGVDTPLIETLVISPGDLHTAEGYDEIYDHITELNSYYYAGFGVLTDGAIMEPSAENMAPMSPTPTMKPATNGAVVNEEFRTDEFAGDALADDLKTGASGSGKDYSATNTQKENVDEADIIKTDGRYIYRLTGHEVVIIDAEAMTVVSRTKPLGNGSDDTDEPGLVTATTSAAVNGVNQPVMTEPAVAPDVAIEPGVYFSKINGYLNDIYVSGDRLAVLYTRYGMFDDVSTEEYIGDRSGCGVMVYDISDRTAPVLLGDYVQSGNLTDSRLMGNYIYLVSGYYVYGGGITEQPETFVPCVEVNGERRVIAPGDVSILPEIRESSYTVMTSINILDGTSHDSTKAAFGAAATVYADTEGIILAFGGSKSETVDTQENGENVNISSGSNYTTLVSYLVQDGIIAQTTSGEVPGSLLNQFSIDRHNGIVRVVTTIDNWEQKIYTDGVDRYEYDGGTTNGLYTLDRDMNILGKLDGLAEDERVYSVRFSGDIGYFVTFRQVDPLFAVDLSDPASPTMLSALKIPGFSQYMHPYADGLMFGLGMDADPESGATRGLKLSMFDISDPADVTECAKHIFEDIWWSEGLNNHHAVLVSAARDIIAFPVDNGYMICGYSADRGFHVRHELEFDRWGGGTRGLFIGDSFYICTDAMLYRFDINTFEATGELEIAPADGEYGRSYILFD
ncbi:MAG: hypothetical protein E7554_09400 [Ruminococcaceae bacterium]|nr:hypothetical protein [Oscillospiraceae bacterium]